jgi:TRAP-type C4-dicarboxylate transport system substrate-binding protein
MKAFRFAVMMCVFVVPLLLSAQTTRLRLASVLPVNSVWDRSLKEMASEWQKVTGGRIRAQVRTASGDEATLVRRMRMNNPQVAALSPLGLQEIDESFSVFGIPFLFASDEEALHVLEALTPELRQALARRNLVLINWGHGGWANIFSAEPIETLADLRKAKLFTSSGDDDTVRWYKENGFQPVPLALTDVLMGLNTGLINAYPSSPYAALAYQWYRQTSHMLDVPLAPLFGATVMTERAWSRVSQTDRDAILKTAKVAQDRLFSDVPEQDREAVSEMERRGLTVSAVDEAMASSFRNQAEGLMASWRGDMVPTEIYDAAATAIREFRAQ